MTDPEPADSDGVDASLDRAQQAAADQVRQGESDRGPDPDAPRASIADRLAGYESVLEVGIGRRPEVAALLAARGLEVTAIDVHSRPVPDGVRFVQEDIVDVAEQLEANPASERSTPVETDHYCVDAIYALNLPPELHQPASTVARAVESPLLFTTLGTDPATVPARAVSIGRETLYVARDRSP